jgi:hypothetical protein
MLPAAGPDDWLGIIKGGKGQNWLETLLLSLFFPGVPSGIGGIFHNSGGHAITGTVSGSAASGVTVNLSGASTASFTTAADGRYYFSGLSNGNYTITPSLAGKTFSPAAYSLTISGNDANARNFTD